MAFIGNTVQTQGFTPAIDYFNGNGVTVTFTLSRPIASVAQVIVAVDNVIQNPSSAFGVVGNSITFTSAPLAGTNNIWVEYTSLITTYQGISQDPTVIGDIRATGGYLAEGDFGNSFVDGNLIDYVTGAGRLTVGELDDLVFYHGGTSARSEMMRLSYANNSYITGNLGIGTSTPGSFGKLVVKTSSTSEAAGLAVMSSTNDSFLTIYNSGSVHNIGATYSSTGSYQPIAFVTSGTERMRIDSSGQVTMPYQPAFRAFTGTSFTGSTVVIFGSTQFNTGGHYSTSTGRFTAPIAGRYFFTFYLLSAGGYSGSFWGGLRRNGTSLAFAEIDWPGNYRTIATSTVVQLAAGDYVDVLLAEGNTYAGGGSVGEWSAFSGYLIG